MPSDLSDDFALSQEVFVGEVLFSMELPQAALYLTKVETSYTGCSSEGSTVWIQTSIDGASCGTSFSLGERYLIFANKSSGMFGFALQTDSCSGNRRMSGVEAADLEYLSTRKSCCGESCACQPGVEQVSCDVNPCSLAVPCEGAGRVRCEVNNCGGCTAEFYNSDGVRVCTGKEDAINRCADHKGYEFGDCGGYPGWLVLDGRCQLVSSGCGTLANGNMPVFPTQAACESACNLEPKLTFCGGGVSCDLSKTYCQESLPGVEPPPGEPTVYFDCNPLPEACADNPSCENCFEALGNGLFMVAEGAPGECFDNGQGEMMVYVAYP